MARASAVVTIAVVCLALGMCPSAHAIVPPWFQVVNERGYRATERVKSGEDELWKATHKEWGNVSIKVTNNPIELKEECRNHKYLCSAGTLCAKEFFTVTTESSPTLMAKLLSALMTSQEEWGVCVLEEIHNTLDDWLRRDREYNFHEDKVLPSARSVLLGLATLDNYQRYHVNLTPSSLYIVHAPWDKSVSSLVMKIGDFQFLKKKDGVAGNPRSFYSLPNDILYKYPVETMGTVLAKHSFGVILISWARGDRNSDVRRIFGYRDEQSHGKPAVFASGKIIDKRVDLVKRDGRWDTLERVIEMLVVRDRNAAASSNYDIMNAIIPTADRMPWENPRDGMSFTDVNALSVLATKGDKTVAEVLKKGMAFSYTEPEDATKKWGFVYRTKEMTIEQRGERHVVTMLAFQRLVTVSNFGDTEYTQPGLEVWYGQHGKIVGGNTKGIDSIGADDSGETGKVAAIREKFCAFYRPLVSEYCSDNVVENSITALECANMSKCPGS